MNQQNNIIKLFHAGFFVLEDPDIYYGKKNADFGQGFYLSNDGDFSNRWAKTRAGQSTYVNSYELNLSDLKIKYLKRDLEWYNYIFANRRGREDSFAEYDVIIGPIANDTIYDVMGITTSGHLEESEALQLLQIGPEYTQIAIKSLKAKEQLKWLGAVEIEQGNANKFKEIVAAEKTQYQELLAKAMEEIFD